VPSQWTTFFGADDVDATLQVITDNGGTVLRPPEDTRTVGSRQRRPDRRDAQPVLAAELRLCHLRVLWRSRCVPGEKVSELLIGAVKLFLPPDNPRLVSRETNTHFVCTAPPRCRR